MNKFIKTISEDKLCYEFVKSLNGILDLTDRELRVFSVLMRLQIRDIELKLTRVSVDRKENRKFMERECGISRENLSRYISLYKRKGLLIKNIYGDTLVYMPLIPDIIGSKTVQISLILKLE